MITLKIAKDLRSFSNEEGFSYTGDLEVGDLVSISAADTVERTSISSGNPGVGFVSQIVSEATCLIVSTGLLALSGLSTGNLYYAGEGGQILSASSPALEALPKQPIGRAKSTTSLKIQIGHPFFFTP